MKMGNRLRKALKIQGLSKRMVSEKTKENENLGIFKENGSNEKDDA